ncbi:uncharacterized protein L969DRAFT_92527 [Mixia osmundae IAM 14324]|uniref:Aminomethyltransferase n=1 Tax=Mixia osmundae (strain CBS 9802 / IAM 14324 / JCM 22182 / KY 12970) TaxID=764103 RepID=G7DXT5_MIXOS|nr:uncharacterized protein L969DRAFT_92527 [Mixia osmundae IAM 14324]KEI41298.1 hypothetical protein L969DRAFT_92527 [Mixia osmundae IAM 14324]GAA95395.1 hypothetical protein E5Q_02049 [Mixia osmundae IAM 14324]
MQRLASSLAHQLPRSATRQLPAGVRINLLVQRHYAEDSGPRALRQTKLYDLHRLQGGKMVPFGGFDMPLFYKTTGGQVVEHKHVRAHAGLFDVSHMVQSKLVGKGATEFLMRLTPTSIDALAFTDTLYSSSLSVLLNHDGGILDDLLITRQGEDEYYIVTNAGRREQDLHWIREQLAEFNSANTYNIRFDVLEKQGLVALQGPKAMRILQQFTDFDLTTLHFGKATFANVDGVRCHIARGGYTGEDGFEISIPPKETTSLSKKILSHQDVMLIGLAARDSLRLEAGMCLYGHDLNETINPVEASLAWIVSKARRTPESATFIGAQRVLQVLREGPAKRRVGFVCQSAVPREGAPIFTEDGSEQIGVITSGIPSPTANKNVSMGYIKSGYHKQGTAVQVAVRRQNRDAVVAKLPFVEPKYYRG